MWQAGMSSGVEAIDIQNPLTPTFRILGGGALTGTAFTVALTIPMEYPFRPPDARVAVDSPGANLDCSGLEAFFGKEDWSPARNIKDVLARMAEVLAEGRLPPPAGAPRFAVGQQVKCRIGPGTDSSAWILGAVVGINYREVSWPRGQIVPYQVELHDGRLIYAPKDDDRIIRKVDPSPLHQAVKCQDMVELLEVVKQLKASSQTEVTLDSSDECASNGPTALMAAIECGWMEGALGLLAQGASACTRDACMRTPLIVAAACGEFRLAEALIQAKADVNAADKDPDQDPNYTSANHIENNVHRTALHYAAELGNVPLVSRLLRGKADPNATERQFQTPLHLAFNAHLCESDTFRRGHGVQSAGIFSNQELDGSFGSVSGPSVQCSDAVLRWPVCWDAGAQDSPLLSDRLLEEDKLHHTREAAIDLLLEAKADVNVGNQVQGESFTMLHHVARAGDTSLTRKMLAARADANRQDTKQGFSPLHIAAKAKHHDVIQLLINADADTALTISSGKTAADLAKLNHASTKTLRLLGGSEIAVGAAPPANGPSVGSLAALTPEQRAALFLD